MDKKEVLNPDGEDTVMAELTCTPEDIEEDFQRKERQQMSSIRSPILSSIRSSILS